MQRDLRRADRCSGAPGEGRRFLGRLTVPAARRQPVAGSLLVTRCQAVTTSLVKPANTGPLGEEAPARCEKDLWLLAEDQAGTGPAPERVSARGGSPGVAGGGGGWIRSGAPERDPEGGVTRAAAAVPFPQRCATRKVPVRTARALPRTPAQEGTRATGRVTGRAAIRAVACSVKVLTGSHLPAARGL